MQSVRVIPCLDVDAGRVVKGVQLRRPPRRRRPGRSWPRGMTVKGPTRSCSSTSRRRPTQRDTMVDVVRRTAEEVFIPLTVGGGVRTVDDARAPLAGRRRQGRRQHRSHRAARADQRDRHGVRGPVRRRRHRRQVRARRQAGRGTSRSTPTAVVARPGSTPSRGPPRSSNSAPVRSSSPRWTVTAPVTASTSS